MGIFYVFWIVQVVPNRAELLMYEKGYFRREVTIFEFKAFLVSRVDSSCPQIQNQKPITFCFFINTKIAIIWKPVDWFALQVNCIQLSLRSCFFIDNLFH